MSAIFGRLELGDAQVDRARFLSCFQKLKPYGPDLSETWVEGSVAVGRQLLRIAPAARNERLIGPTDGLLVVADAILDNRDELVEALGLTHAELSEASDTELIRRSFLRWGEDCVHRLLGDFAFAAIRPRSRELFLARDHIGSRPLFWALRRETLIFSSAVEGIISFDEWKWSIAERAVAEHLLCPLLPVSRPFFDDVLAVPPGSFVALRGARISAGTWWRPSTESDQRLKTSTDVLGACRTLLERVVADRINTDGRVGAHLSGGVDSTGVAVIASRDLRSRGRSLSRAFAWSPPLSDLYPASHAQDERRPIQELADAEGIPVQFGGADSANLLEFIRRPMEFNGEADLADEIPVLQAAGNSGLRVMLSGWGGDEAFSAHGRGHFVHLVAAGELGKAKRFAQFHGWSLRRPTDLLLLGWREVIYPILPSFPYQLLSPYRSYIKTGSFISDGLLQQHAEVFRARRQAIKFGPDPNKNIERHITAGHITMRMESWAAWSAPYGVQYRYPLTDRRLLEFLFTLPPEQLFLNDQPRGLARAVLADCIPPSASKRDVANERLRRDVRAAAWRAIAQEVADGGYDDDCPWLDTAAFRAHALKPLDQNETKNILAFAELFAAARIWALYRRAAANGWV